MADDSDKESQRQAAVEGGTEEEGVGAGEGSVGVAAVARRSEEAAAQNGSKTDADATRTSLPN